MSAQADPHPSPRVPLKLLLLDDDPVSLALLERVLGAEGHSSHPARTIQEARALLGSVNPDVAIVDVYLGEEDGLEFVRELRRGRPDVGIIVISMEDTSTLAMKATQSGADNFLGKPISPAALVLGVNKIGELYEQRQRSIGLERELRRSIRDTVFPEIITHGDAMKSALRLVEKVAPTDLSVLIFGESGTGKELVARGIHQYSLRARRNFVELNCAALPSGLVESELFGHERGAFTGAIAMRPGKMEQANGGSLFLDEIGELPLEIQVKLLRALQEKRVTRVGGKEAISCDFRLICATNRDLVKEVEAGRFREDLFHRIAVFPIKLPALRERKEDLDLLLAHFLRQERVASPRVTPEARDLIHHYHWPGNVRELKNFAQAISLLSERGVIDEAAVRSYFGPRLASRLPASAPAASAPSGLDPGIRPRPRPVRTLDEVEREEIMNALVVYGGNVPDAARALGLGRATLYRHLKRYQIDPEQLRLD